MRKRSERGLRKAQELEGKVQALEEALKVDVSCFKCALQLDGFNATQ